MALSEQMSVLALKSPLVTLWFFISQTFVFLGFIIELILPEKLNGSLKNVRTCWKFAMK